MNHPFLSWLNWRGRGLNRTAHFWAHLWDCRSPPHSWIFSRAQFCVQVRNLTTSERIVHPVESRNGQSSIPVPQNKGQVLQIPEVGSTNRPKGIRYFTTYFKVGIPDLRLSDGLIVTAQLSILLTPQEGPRSGHPTHWQYNILNQGAAGALCQPPDVFTEGGWCWWLHTPIYFSL